MRRLNQLGALPIKNSAYLLPSTDEALEDFEWLRREIEQGEGEAWIFRSEALGGLSDEGIQEAFRQLRTPDFAALAQDFRGLLEERTGAPGGTEESRRRRLKRRYDELVRIDFFGAPGREEVEVLMKETERALDAAGASASAAVVGLGEYQGRTWVTRKGVKVDRMASGWLIRRFIDPAAQFTFVDPSSYRHQERELRFDMFEGEFTHRGEMCTFEVLTGLLGTADAALTAIGEVVHDIDLKDGRYQRPETAGIAPLIEGIALRHAEDARRMAEGAVLFDALYEQMRWRYAPGAKP